jgi:hypothetical protein
MSRKKRDYFPLIPRRVQDVLVKGSWKRNWRGQEFLIHQDPRLGSLVYPSPTCASKLQRCEHLFADGTFKTCPKPFTQLVTIHSKYGNRILPFAFCMLRSKDNALYCEMLNQIKIHVRRITDLPLDPHSFVCDFEVPHRMQNFPTLQYAAATFISASRCGVRCRNWVWLWHTDKTGL